MKTPFSLSVSPRVVLFYAIGGICTGFMEASLDFFLVPYWVAPQRRPEIF